MSIAQFSPELAKSLIHSSNQFPVDFDRAWQWLGFSTKRSAKTSLLDCGFVVGEDLLIDVPLGTLAVPRPEECIMLTVEAFKSWGMMARTEQGKLVRKYFLECEKVAKQKTSLQSIANEKDQGKLRLEGKEYRRTYTDRIQQAGGKGSDYAKATNETYLGATGLTANQIKEQRGIVKSKPARDGLNLGELQIVSMTEWQLAGALPEDSTLGDINQASRSQAERLKAALMVWGEDGKLLN